MDYRREGGPDRNRHGGRERYDRGYRSGGGGYNRRPYDRPRQDRERDQDRAVDAIDDIEKRLGGLIIRVGDKVTPSLETNLNTLAGILDNDYAKHSATILKTLKACILELPMKTAIYGTLTGLLNTKDAQIGGTIVKMAAELLQENLFACQWRSVKLLLRFLGELVNSNVILPTTLLNVLDGFLTVLEEPTVLRARADCAVYLVLATLPWCAADLHDRNPHDFDMLLAKCEAYVMARDEDGVEGLDLRKVFRDDQCPYAQEDPLTMLIRQIQNLQKEDWEVGILIKPSQNFDAELGTATQHELPSFEFPPHTDNVVYLSLPPMFSLFLGENSNGEHVSATLPDPNSIAHFIVRDNVTDVMSLFEVNRKECAKYLFMVQYSYTTGTFTDPTVAQQQQQQQQASDENAMEGVTPTGWSIDEVLAEVLFCELFKLPTSEFKAVYYASLLVEMCKAFPDSFPMVLAKGISILFERLSYMDVECACRFWTWLSHHLSNFGYLWNWAEWSSALDLPDNHPKVIFIRETLEKTIRLAYYERIKEALPEDFQKFIAPEAPAPCWKFESPDHPYNAMALAVLNSLRAKNSIEQIEQTLDSMKNAPRLEGLSASEREDFIRDLFVQCVLMLGSKSFSHILNVIERYLVILQKMNSTPEARLHTVKIVAAFWKNNTQFLGILLDKMLNYRVVDPIAIVKWVFEPEMHGKDIKQGEEGGESGETAGQEWYRSYVWEILKNTLNKVLSRVAQVKDKLEEVRREADVDPTKPRDVVEAVENTLSIVNREQKEVFLTLYQKFVGVLRERLASLEGDDEDMDVEQDRWWRNALGWFTEIGRRYSKEVASFSTTLEAIVFSVDGQAIDSRISNIFLEICRMETGRSVDLN
ncbi:Component of the cap-binding complex (CBC) [Actinomortierella ambigua]|nr:Component of the cap-binding complex (CBC) [Actinomortierella ambigua]